MSEDKDAEKQKLDILTAVKKEKERIVALIITKGNSMTSDYRNTVKHTGGLLSTSMGYAYSKGINDIIKLLTKEVKNEKSV